MARGFSATLGSGTTDKITSALTTYSTQRSWFINTYRREASPSTFRRMFDTVAAGGGTDGLVRLYTSSGASPLYQFEMNWSGALGNWTFAGPSDSAWHRILITYDAGSTANNPVVYVDGVSVTVNRVTAPSGTITPATTPQPILGNRPASDRAWDGMLEAFAVWDLIVSAANAYKLGALLYSPDLFPTGLVEHIPMISANTGLAGTPTIVGTAVQTGQTYVTFAGDEAAAFAVTVPAETGAETFTGTQAMTTGPPAVAVSGTEVFTGTETASLAVTATAATGTEQITGTGASSFAVTAPAATSTETFTGTEAASLVVTALAATGAETLTGTVTVSLAVTVPAETGAERFTGTQDVTLAVTVPAAVSTEAFAATGAAAFGVTAPAGTGTEQDVGDVVIATAVTVPGAAGAETFAGTTAVAVAVTVPSGASADSITGSLSVVTGATALAASGLETFMASDAVALGATVPAVAGLETFSGTGGAAFSVVVVLGGQPQAVAGSGSVTLQATAPSAAGSVSGTGVQVVLTPSIGGGVLLPIKQRRRRAAPAKVPEPAPLPSPVSGVAAVIFRAAIPRASGAAARFLGEIDDLLSLDLECETDQPTIPRAPVLAVAAVVIPPPLITALGQVPTPPPPPRAPRVTKRVVTRVVARDAEGRIDELETQETLSE